MEAVLKCLSKCQGVIGWFGSYQKLKAINLGSVWKNVNAFVQSVHFHLLSCPTIYMQYTDEAYL